MGMPPTGEGTGSALRAACLATVAFGAACNLGVDNYGGSKIVMTLSSAARPTDTAHGHHLELWATDGDALVRLLYAENQTDVGQVQTNHPQAAYAIVQAVDFNDPCEINLPSSDPKAPPGGTLVWQPDGQLGLADPLSCPGAADDMSCRMQQATAVQNRMHELTDLQAAPLLAMVPWDDGQASRPMVAADATPDARLAACEKYWNNSVYAYNGNPRELTAPIHGFFLGAIDFVSTKPSQIAGGIQIDSDYALPHLESMWMTDTTATVANVDPTVIDCKAQPSKCRGSIFVAGDVDFFANEVVHIPLNSPDHSINGSVSVYTNLGSDSVQF